MHLERAGDGDALLLPAGERRRIDVRLVGEADHREELAPARFRVRAAQELQLRRRERDVVHDRVVREQVEHLEHHADLLAELVDVLRVAHVRAEDFHRAALRLLEAVQAAEQRAFPRAGRPDDADDFALIDVERDIFQDLVRTERFHHVIDFNDHIAASSPRPSTRATARR